MIIGYARVSKADGQDTSAQIEALKLAGCERIFEDHSSGGRWERPELKKMMEQLRSGDTVVVWKLDRLSRSLKDTLHFLETLASKSVSFRSVTEQIETTSPAGMMFTQMLGCFAEFERQMIRERTRAGLASSRREGRIGGRKRKLSPIQRLEVIAMVDSGSKTASEVSRLFNVHRSTISRLLAESKFELPKMD